MKEITRIHLARVSYDIELGAKHQLEKYLDELAKHTDSDVMNDIESRMVELLAERGVTSGGVVTLEDVTELRTQLGEPRDFADDQRDNQEGDDDNDTSIQNRRLYRDMDNALLAGVLSGIASYFRVDPVIVRIVFVIVAIGSFGWALIVYALMWFLIPPARTAGEKLTLKGQPITAATIREFSEREFTNERLNAIRSFLSFCAGIAGVVAAVGAVVATSAVAFRIAGDGGAEVGDSFMTGLLLLSGLFAAWLFVVLSEMFFRQKYTADKANAVAVLFVLTLLFGGAFVVLGISGHSTLIP